MAAMMRTTFDDSYPQKLVGKMAPALNFESVLADNNSVNSPKIQLKGKVTLIDFWFTTCGPCRASVPHLNKLVREFSPKGLQTFAITFETANVVQDYLKLVPIAAPIGVDVARNTIKSYGVNAYPTTFLIGRDGKVIACASPDSFTEQIISDALAGKPVKVRQTVFKPVTAAEINATPSLDTGTPALSSFRIVPTTMKGSSSFSITSAKASIRGVPLDRMLQYLYNLEPGQYKMNLLPEERLFDAEALVPGATGSTASDLLKAALISTFHLTIKVEYHPTKVAVFRIKGALKGVKPWDGKTRSATGNDYRGMTLASIIDSVAYELKLPGVDETKDKNRYDFSMDFDYSKPLDAQSLEKFGLEVTRETRDMPFTTITQGK